MSNQIYKKVAFFTLGCKVNQSESQRMARQFEKMGYQIVDFEETALVYIINTCTVTQMADQKSRKIIRGVKKRSPESLLVVTGCYAQSGVKQLQAMADVDLLIDNQSKNQLPKIVESALSIKETKEAKNISQCPYNMYEHMQHKVKGLNRTRATLKIQEGCRQFCSYCIIPYVRGSWQSLSQEEVLHQTAELEAEGYKEIVLLGIHLGAYGWDRGEKEGLSDILMKILQQFPQIRFRLGSLEPMEATKALLTLIRDYPNACKHLHLPLQYGQDQILKKMNRPYNTEEFRSKIDEVRLMIPDVSLTTDIMVGFPGESETDFNQCMNFVENIGFARLHVFAYSRRPGTPAALMSDQVSRKEKTKRSHQMINLGDELAKQYAKKWFGRKQQVLVEEEIEPNLWHGHTDNYLEVTFIATNKEIKQLKGTIQIVTLTGDPSIKNGSWDAVMD